MQNPGLHGIRWGRCAGGALLLMLLAASGYAGAVRAPVQTVSVPVSCQSLSAWEISEETMQEIQMRLEHERRQEIALLDSVIAGRDASDELAAQALSQKTALAARMETEAQTEAVLAYMGYAQVQAVCGAGRMTLIAPWQYASDDADRVKMIAAAAEQAQISAECVKIILPKNE